MAAPISALRIHDDVGLSRITAIWVNGKRVEVAYNEGPENKNIKWVFPADEDAPLYRACHNDSYYRKLGFELYDKCWVCPLLPIAKQNSLIESFLRREGLNKGQRDSIVALQKSFRLAYPSLEPGEPEGTERKQQPLHFKVVHPISGAGDAEDGRQLHFKIVHPGSDSIEPGTEAVEPDSIESLSDSELRKALADVEERHRPVVLRRALSRA